MVRFRSSIHGQLSLFITTFLVIIVSLAIGASVTLKIADRKTDELDHKWFAGAVMLGELADRVSEFRLAETYRAVALYPKTRAEAELLAEEQRQAIEKLQDEYVALMGDQGASRSMAPVRAAWKAYETAHDAWMKSDTDGAFDEPARHDSSLHRLYKSTDVAIDKLLAANTAEAEAEHTTVHSLMGEVFFVAIVICFAAIALATWLLRRVRSKITRPLEAITRALSELAVGNRAVRVPELHRSDEIGEMAKAFEMFRSNALALDQAHEATRLAQEEAHALARHDALTGLPNRRVFSAELQAALGRAQNGAATYSVLLIDLDRFKEVNDIQGHAAGDVVLCEVARRLKGVLRSTDTVARLGGDEFAIIAEGETELAAHTDGAKHLANKLLSTIRAPITVGDSSAQIGASIGIAICGADGNDDAGLLHAADIAMYRAKRDGRSTFRFFEQSMDEDIRAQAALEADLKIAIGDEQIEPYYQPLVDIQHNRICGFEALARWHHPTRGFVPPDVFIPLVEQLGLMAELTSSVLRHACRDALQWPDEIWLSFNISPSDLKDPALATRLLSIIAQEGFPPHRLEVEITETALVSDIKTAQGILTTLQGRGVKIALDDFGTGYSSLYHLRELKFDKIKIDKSFVQAMLANPESEKIVDAILGLTKHLDLPTVAEGIENPAVMQRLAARGCAYGQGYLFGKAMTATSALALLDQGAAERVRRESVARRVAHARQPGLVDA